MAVIKKQKITGVDVDDVVVHLLSRVQLCDLMNCSMPDFPVLQYTPKFAQTHVY